MTKKVLVFVMSLFMVLTAAAPAFAAEKVSDDADVQAAYDAYIEMTDAMYVAGDYAAMNTALDDLDKASGDIDEDTALYYKSVSGLMASRLKANISRDNPPHFILDSHDRCPFLNADNLCDIILSLGEDHLCTICSEHPRFHNALPGRQESGVGLCCEEAARLILGWERPAALCAYGSSEVEDDLIEIRDHVIKLLQNREKPIRERTKNVLNYARGILPQKSMEEWADFFLGLERLDEHWTTLLTLLREQWRTVDIETFDMSREEMARLIQEYL